MPNQASPERRKTAEELLLDEARERGVPWKQWGPYLSERQWGTVREDYSENGDAWNYFTHDQTWSRAYHWGEDGLAGFSDDCQRLCFAFGDNGAGIGASHQTGWTGVIAGMIDIFGKLDTETFLQGGPQAALGREKETA